MGGLLLIAYFVGLSVASEAVAVGIALVVEMISPLFGLLAFFIVSGLGLALSWPLALRLTE
jgi:hypothetical protein